MCTKYKMQVSVLLMLVVWIRSSSGQSVSVADTYMVKEETGRVTCQISRSGHIDSVTWDRRVLGGTQSVVYVYWPATNYKDPQGDLVGRSDYEHFSNGTSRLVIHRVRTPPDQANYTCRVDFGGPPEEDTGQVFVIERQPAPSISVADSPVTEGDRVVFLCTPAGGGETILQYEFRRTDGGTLIGNINQGRLTIDQTVRNDQGNYGCRVRTLAGYSPWSGDVSLEVDYPPDSVVITGYTNGTYLYSDNDVTLTCTAAGGRPHAESVRWNCLGEGSGAGTAVPGGRQNSFTTKVNRSWHGQLCSCSAWQRRNQGPFSTSVFFTVSWPPTGPSVVFDPRLPWLEGNTYRTTCQLSDVGNPASTYTWFKDNQNLNELPGAATISLPVTKSDNNKEIKCEVQNNHTQNRPPQQPVQAKQNLDVQCHVCQQGDFKLEIFWFLFAG